MFGFRRGAGAKLPWRERPRISAWDVDRLTGFLPLIGIGGLYVGVVNLWASATGKHYAVAFWSRPVEALYGIGALIVGAAVLWLVVIWFKRPVKHEQRIKDPPEQRNRGQRLY